MVIEIQHYTVNMAVMLAGHSYKEVGWWVNWWHIWPSSGKWASVLADSSLLGCSAVVRLYCLCCEHPSAFMFLLNLKVRELGSFKASTATIDRPPAPATHTHSHTHIQSHTLTHTHTHTVTHSHSHIPQNLHLPQHFCNSPKPCISTHASTQWRNKWRSILRVKQQQIYSGNGV
jgi:hypothetical protein